VTRTTKETEVKRVRILSLLTALSAVGVLAFAATASAETGETYLCKTKPSNHICREAYPVGTAIKAKLASGTTLQIKDEYGTFLLDTCTNSELNFSLTSQGKSEAGLLNQYFAVSGCTEPTYAYRWESPERSTWPVAHIANTDNGRGYGRTELEFKSNLWAGWCRYQMTEAEMVGGTEAQIRAYGGYGYQVYGAVQGEGSCIPKIRLYGTYNITTPTPLYVEE
jgi:hypothetical protein